MQTIQGCGVRGPKLAQCTLLADGTREDPVTDCEGPDCGYHPDSIIDGAEVVLLCPSCQRKNGFDW